MKQIFQIVKQIVSYLLGTSLSISHISPIKFNQYEGSDTTCIANSDYFGMIHTMEYYVSFKFLRQENLRFFFSYKKFLSLKESEKTLQVYIRVYIIKTAKFKGKNNPNCIPSKWIFLLATPLF